jgi:hypothetical protein
MIQRIVNSHSNTFQLLDPLAKAAGHPDQMDDETYVFGAPLWWNWDHSEQRRKLAEEMRGEACVSQEL